MYNSLQRIKHTELKDKTTYFTSTFLSSEREPSLDPLELSIYEEFPPQAEG
jgi:hypothetical protein